MLESEMTAVLALAGVMVKPRRLPYSKSEIDRIGDRFRDEEVEAEILAKLDEYRRSFEPAYREVVRRIRGAVHLDPSARLGKSVPSIVHKLKRESIRLSQMQDISGCRFVVPDIAEQDRVVGAIANLFDEATIVDRRVFPSAVHVVVRIGGFPVEIQVRTELQHLWGEYSEELSDLVDDKLKYGGGPDDWRRHLDDAAQLVSDFENSTVESSELERETSRKKLIAMFRDRNLDRETLP